MLSLAFKMVNASGIYITQEDIPVAFKGEEDIEQIKEQFAERGSALDYLQVSGFVIYYGIMTFLSLIKDLLFCYDDILKAFHVPNPYATYVGNAINFAICLGLGYMFLRRS